MGTRQQELDASPCGSHRGDAENPAQAAGLKLKMDLAVHDPPPWLYFTPLDGSAETPVSYGIFLSAVDPFQESKLPASLGIHNFVDTSDTNQKSRYHDSSFSSYLPISKNVIEYHPGNMRNDELIGLSTSGDVIRCTLRRPPLNFLNQELLHQLEAYTDSLGESPPCRALILDAEGSAFSAGLDLSELTRDGIFLLLEQFHRVAVALNNFPRPTIALVQGMALGAGNELLACCDFVFASEKASFGQPEIKVGGIPSLAALVLPPLIGQRKAMEMILTGNLIEAREAEKIGLIHRALPEDRLASASEQLLNTLRGLSVAVVEVAVRSARMTRTSVLEQHLREYESLYLDQLMELEDSTEGVKAFLEKRAPRWKNQ